MRARALHALDAATREAPAMFNEAQAAVLSRVACGPPRGVTARTPAEQLVLEELARQGLVSTLHPRRKDGRVSRSRTARLTPAGREAWTPLCQRGLS